MGRGKRLNEEMVADAIRLKKNGLSQRDIAAIIGVTEFTFSRWINDPKNKLQEQLAQGLKTAEAEWRGALEQIIIKAAQKKDWKAAAWLLERKNPELYSLAPARFGVDEAERREERLGEVSEVLVAIRKASE